MVSAIDANEESRGHLADYIGVVIVFLMGLGAVMVFSAGASLDYELDFSRFYAYPGLRQVLYFPVAVVVLLIASCINYRWLRLRDRWWKSPMVYLTLFAIILLALVLIIGPEINEARRWLRLTVGPASISFQPSELAKWTMVFLMAAVCAKVGDGIRSYWRRFLPLCGLLGLVCGLIVIEDFGTAAFIALMSMVMLIVAGVKWWHVLTLVPFGVAGFVAALLDSPHRLKRVEAFLYPEKWGDTVRYQADQSLIAIGSGGIWGKGLGRGICKYGHLPEDTTDFVFAIVGEELGLIGTLAVIGLFILFLVLGLMVALRCRDRFGRLLAIGIVLTIGIQAALNIGVVTVVLPTKGIPLPFISSGGTSMLLSAAAVGILLNIASQTERPKEKRGASE